MNTWTTVKIRNLKGKRKFTSLTAYDYSTAQLVDAAGIELILVGDSLAMTMLGYETTVPVTLDEMMHHASAVVRGTKNALVVVDMPFMSYQVSTEQALANAGLLIQKTGAGAVKIEGGALRAKTVSVLTENGIPVLGHIGLTPQSVNAMGGYKIQGKKSSEADVLLNDAKELEKAGAFAIVLECIPAELGADITKNINIPTIGIGAGPDCDAQILVTHDLLGLYSGVTPKFVKQYANLGDEMKKAFVAYKADVENKSFPSNEHCYS